MAAPLNECPLVLSVSTEQPTVEPGRVYEGDKQAGRGGRGRGKMAWWCLSVSLSPIDNICTFWSFERSGGGGRWRVMTSIVSRREREREREATGPVGPLSCVHHQPAVSQPAVSHSHLCWDLEPKSHQFYVHKDIQVLTTKQCWILEKQFHFFH